MAPAGPGEAWAYEADTENRDPNNLNDHLQVHWTDVFAEPEGIHSNRCCWRYSAKCFEMWKSLCYVIATALCGIPVAMCWGCYFSCVAFNHVWCFAPMLRDLRIDCAVRKKVFGICAETCIEPCCIAVGRIFTPFGQKGGDNNKI